MNCISGQFYFLSNSNKKYEHICSASRILFFTMAIALGILGLYSAYRILPDSAAYTGLYFSGAFLFLLLGVASSIKNKKSPNKPKVVPVGRLRPRRLFS